MHFAPPLLNSKGGVNDQLEVKQMDWKGKIVAGGLIFGLGAESFHVMEARPQEHLELDYPTTPQGSSIYVTSTATSSVVASFVHFPRR